MGNTIGIMDCIFHCGDIHFNSVLWLILQITEPSILANGPQEAGAEKRPKNEVDKELAATDSQTNTVNPDDCSRAQEPESPVHTEKIKAPSKDEEVLQHMQNGQDRVLKAEVLGEPLLLNETILVETFAWSQGDDEGENVLSAEKDEKSYRNRSPGRDPGFDLASSVDSSCINTTEAIMQQTAEVLWETDQVPPAETQETVSRMAGTE